MADELMKYSEYCIADGLVLFGIVGLMDWFCMPSLGLRIGVLCQVLLVD
jgi:hypothetical protein